MDKLVDCNTIVCSTTSELGSRVAMASKAGRVMRHAAPSASATAVKLQRW